MKIKCIGGERDGMMIDVLERDLHENNYIQVPVYRQLNAYIDLNAKPDFGEVSSSYVHYKVKFLNFGDRNGDNEKFPILIPNNWSLREALIHQFGK